MKHLWDCRRTFVAVFAMLCLLWLGYRGADVAGSVAFIVASIAGANASQNIFNKNGGLASGKQSMVNQSSVAQETTSTPKADIGI